MERKFKESIYWLYFLTQADIWRGQIKKRKKTFYSVVQYNILMFHNRIFRFPDSKIWWFAFSSREWQKKRAKSEKSGDNVSVGRTFLKQSTTLRKKSGLIKRELQKLNRVWTFIITRWYWTAFSRPHVTRGNRTGKVESVNK